MAASITLTSVTVNGDGSIVFQFDKNARTFDSVQAAIAFIRQRFSRDDMMDIAVALCLTRQPTLNNPSVFAGHSLTVDLILANWGTLT